MSKATLVATADGHVCGVHSWTEGFTALKCPTRKVRTEDDVLAVALWLEKHGRQDEALAYLEHFIERKPLN